MSNPPHPRAREPGSWRWAGLLVALMLAAALGAWLLPPDGVVAGCERDGHFQRMGQVACGLTAVNAPYGPLLPWLGAALTPLVGTPYLAGRLVGLLSLLGMVGLTWRATVRFGGGGVAAALAAALVALNPHLLQYGTMACTDMPASLLWILALYLAAVAVEGEPGAWRAGAAGAAGALAVLARVQLLLPLVALALLVGVLGHGRWRARLGRGLLFFAGIALALGLAMALGRRHYPDLQSVLVQYLGWQAFAWALPRLGVLAAGHATADGAPGLAVRLAWGAWLAVRVSGGLPLLALGAALWLGAWHRVRSWRAALLVVLASAACWAGTAWSHPPPDLGARRFFLALVPPGITLAVLLGAGLRRWVPRWVALVAPSVALLGAGSFLVAEVGALRGIELRSPREGWPAFPMRRDRATPEDRAAWRAGRALLAAQDVGCAPVYTNYHNAAGIFLDARLLVGLPDTPMFSDLPGPRPAAQGYLLWVAPPGASVEVEPLLPGFVARPLGQEDGVGTWLLVPLVSEEGP